MKTAFLSFLCAAFATITSAAADTVPGHSPPPVSATFISKHWGKPPSKSIRAALVLTNRGNTPLWFILPYNCDEPPKLNNPLLIPKGFEPTWIGADGFNTGTYNKVADRNKGEAIQLTVLFVEDDKAFRLFRLPPGGRVEFESYNFIMWSEYVHSFRVWTAAEIKVNGKETLENWLPYKTLSEAQTFVPSDARSDNLNFDTTTLLGSRKDFRKEPITQLDLKLMESWDIPFENFD